MAVLNIRRLPGEKIPDGAVYIGRGGPWGNPYIIGIHGGRYEVIRKYAELLWAKVRGDAGLEEELARLHGRDLVCFCKPLPCHGDVLVEAAKWAAERRLQRRSLDDEIDDLLG